MKKVVLVLLIAGLLLSGFAFGKTKLVWTVHWTDFQIDGVKDENGNVVTKGLQQYVDEYMAQNPDIEIEIQMVPFDDYLKNILISHTSGDVSDIYGLYSIWGVQLVESAILDKVPSDIVKTIKSEFVPVSVDGASIENTVWGIPMEIDNYTLIYNKKILAEAGYDNPPATWAELEEMAKNLTVKADDGTISRYGFSFLSGWDSAVVHPYMAILHSMGGKFLEDDFSKCCLDSDVAVAALEKELNLFRNGATDPAASVWGFTSGKVAMIVMAPWYETTLKMGFKDAYEETVGIAPIPPVEKLATAGYTWFLAVDNASKNKKEAWDFLRWISLQKMENGATPLGELMAKNIGAIPPKESDIDAFPEELNDLYTSVFVEQLPYTHQEPNVAQAQEIKTALMREIVEAWNGRKTAREALEDAKDIIDEILEEFYW